VRIVVDTSVLIAALMKPSRVRYVYLAFFSAEWVIPRAAEAEAERNIERIAARAGVDEANIREVLGVLMRRATLVDIGATDAQYTVAGRLIGPRDPSDVPFVAACLKTQALGIWTLDNDFSGIDGVPRFTTAGVARLAALAGDGPALDD
jgi:predicted nucleic acid-binding protein